MLFNYILTGIIVGEALLTVLCSFIAFRKGYELGAKDFNINHSDVKKVVPTRKAKLADRKANKELEKYEALLENIENYDGTEAHQKEIS